MESFSDRSKIFDGDQVIKVLNLIQKKFSSTQSHRRKISNLLTNDSSKLDRNKSFTEQFMSTIENSFVPTMKKTVRKDLNRSLFLEDAT